MAKGRKAGCYRWKRLCLGITVLFCMAAATKAQTASSPVDDATAQLNQAIAVDQRGDPTEALAMTKALIAAYPQFAPGFKFQGALLDQMGDGNAAETSYEEALKLAPDDAELLYTVGVAKLVAGNHDEAIELLSKRLLQMPQDGDTLFYLAQAYHLKGNNDLALKTIKKSLDAEPDNATVWQKYGELLCSSGDNLAALTWLTKAQKADPSLPRIDFDLGIASYRNEDFENAAQYAGKAVVLDPNDWKAQSLLAESEVKLARWQDAEEPFKRILAAKPDDEDALLGLGHCQFALKDNQAAVDTLNRLVQQDPTIPLAHFYLSRAYAALGLKAEAQHEADLHGKLVEQAGSVEPADERETERATLAQARELLTDNRESEAVQLFRERAKGPTATPGAPELLVGVVYLYMGRSADAERCLRKAMAIEPGVHDAHTYLGMLALQQNDLDGAEREFNAELATQPNSQLATAELGEVRYRQQRWPEAADQIAKSRTVSPALLYMLADSYFHMGKVKEADLTAELIVDYSKDDKASVQRTVDLLNRNQQTGLAQRLSTR
jgi:tetratricopeptide (TPR) repeat protein